jgi:hypothetical protein
VTEAVGLLAAWAPKLRPALRAAKAAGYAFAALDGTLIPVDRVAADRVPCQNPACCPDLLVYARRSCLFASSTSS